MCIITQADQNLGQFWWKYISGVHGHQLTNFHCCTAHLRQLI